ncbi:hypothetical protein PFISCL1PPCAC_26983, partial [Pristionchus fissidentatus]
RSQTSIALRFSSIKPTPLLLAPSTEAGIAMGRDFARMVRDFHETFVILAVPIFSAFLLLMDNEDEVKFKCLYVVVIMSLYWVFEVLPLAITALIPMVLFPALGIMKSDAVAKTYLPDTGFLFIGGLMVAVAVEKSNLHTRAALLVLSLVGSDPRFIMLGFMLVTAFLSMWISNTATAALMVPIVQSVISELVSNQRSGELIERQHLATRRRSIEGRRLSMTRDPLTAIEKDQARCVTCTEKAFYLMEEQSALLSGAKIEAGPSSQTLLPESESRRALVEHEEKMAALCSPSIVRLEQAVVEAENHLIPFPAKGDNHHLLTRAYDEQDNMTLKDMMKYFNERELKMAKGFLISVCYAANIGGAATITGTASNLVLIGQLEKIFPGAETGINFLSWIIFATPMVFLCLMGCWVALCVIFLRNAPKGSHSVSMRLKEKYTRLPSVSFAEIAVSFCFIILLLLWVFRDPKFIPGIGSLFKRGYVTDATSAVFIVIILFVLPETCPSFESKKKTAHKGLLDWQVVQESFPWSVVLLLGGGFALAAGVKESELSQTIGDLLSMLGGLERYTAVTICVIITIGLTNVCSNTVVASIFTPIVAELARGLSINPLLFMLPVTVASSFAFLLPVATPPNAIVFGAGVVGVKDMAKAGMVVSLWCAMLNVANMWVFGSWWFTLDTFPEWANYNELLAGNATSFLLNVLSDNQTVAILTQN